MKILGVIPARYGSTRFPGKPLANIGGKSMIQRVYEQCIKCTSLSRIIIATDDHRIADHAKTFGEVMMTSSSHNSGTDRCMEILNSIGGGFDYLVNIQGDEPFIEPAQIEALVSLLSGDLEIATLAKVIQDNHQIHDPNVVKVVIDKNGMALYFSRNPIPFQRSAPLQEWSRLHRYLKHIGLYAFRSDVLRQITSLPVSNLEKSESLEQLRWLENGYSIKVGLTEKDTQGIDTPEDLERIKGIL